MRGTRTESMSVDFIDIFIRILDKEGVGIESEV